MQTFSIIVIFVGILTFFPFKNKVCLFFLDLHLNFCLFNALSFSFLTVCPSSAPFSASLSFPLSFSLYLSTSLSLLYLSLICFILSPSISIFFSPICFTVSLSLYQALLSSSDFLVLFLYLDPATTVTLPPDR